MTKESYLVKWNQWFRCGPEGDDMDFLPESAEFDTLAKAEQFKADLIAGKHRGRGDMRVYDNEVTIEQKEVTK